MKGSWGEAEKTEKVRSGWGKKLISRGTRISLKISIFSEPLCLFFTVNSVDDTTFL